MQYAEELPREPATWNTSVALESLYTYLFLSNFPKVAMDSMADEERVPEAKSPERSSASNHGCYVCLLKYKYSTY